MVVAGRGGSGGGGITTEWLYEMYHAVPDGTNGTFIGYGSSDNTRYMTSGYFYGIGEPVYRDGVAGEFSAVMYEFTPPSGDNRFQEQVVDGFQNGLDGLGLIPFVGEAFDGANALIYLARGDKTNAALSGAAMVPFLGWGATGAKPWLDLYSKFRSMGCTILN